MAKQNSTGGTGLNYRAKLDLSQAKKEIADFKKMLSDVNVSLPSSGNGGFSTKPLTDYQNELLKIKREKIEQDRIDRQTSLATQAALREEARLRREALAANSPSGKRVTEFSNSQAEIDAYNKAAQGSTVYTSAINAQVVARARDTQQAAIQAVAEGTLRTEQMAATKAVQDDTIATKSNNLTKEQAAKLLLEEKYLQAQRTKELKNSIREELNAKGSLEQRRAALIRLTAAYDKLSPLERATPAGNRLKSIVVGVTDQVGTLEKETLRAQRNVGNYTSAFSKGLGSVWTGLKTIANILPGLGIAGLLAFAIEPLMDYIKGLDLFGDKLKEIKNTAVESSDYKEALSGVTKLKTALDEYHSGQISGKKLVDQYNESIGKTAGNLKTTTEVEAFYNSKADAFVKGMFLRAQAQAALQASTDALAEAQQRALNGPSIADAGMSVWNNLKGILKNGLTGNFADPNTLAALAGDSVKNQDAAVEKLNKKGKAALALFDKLQKESDKFNKANGLDLDGKREEAKRKASAQAAINSQRSLQAQIDALTKKGVDKEKTANEQEVEAVSDKYKKLRDLAIRFNNDPVNKKKGLKVDAGGLYKAESNETTAVINKQQAAALKVTLDEQKKLYTEYEDFKSKVGKEKADARYKDLINTDITYMEKLKQIEADQLDPQKSKGGDEGQANPFAMKLLGEEIAAEKVVQQKRYDDLVTQFMSYADKRKKLTEEFNATMLALENDPGAQAEKREAYERELGDLDDANAKKLGAFQALFNGVDRLSDENARKVVSNAEVMLNSLLASGKISKELAAEIRTLLSNTTKEIADRIPERIINLANQIDRVADAVGEVDEGFGKMLHTVGNVVGQVGNIKKGLGDLKIAQGNGDMLGQLSAGLGIFGAGMSIVSGISKLFDRSAQREAQQAYATENQIKQNEALNRALERQVALINDAYGTDKLAKYAEAQATILKNEQIYTDQLSKRYSLTGNKEVDYILTQVNATGNTALLGFAKDPSVFDRYKIPVNDLNALQALLDAGKLDDSTAKLVQNLIDAKQAAVDLANQLSAETIGSSLDSIADEFIQNLTDGTQDFGKTFEDTIRKSILNGFKGKLIQQQLQGFYDDFAKATSDQTLTPDEIEALRKSYLAASEKAKKDFADLEKATGISLTDSTSSRDSALTKNIKAITSDQASALEGITRGTYDLTKQVSANTSLLNPISKTLGDLYQIASGNLAYNAEIAANTANTVVELKNVVTRLDKVVTNTLPTNLRGGGLG